MTTEAAADWEDGVRFVLTVWHRRSKRANTTEHRITLPTGSVSTAKKWTQETLKHIRCGTDFMKDIGKSELVQVQFERCETLASFTEGEEE